MIGPSSRACLIVLCGACVACGSDAFPTVATPVAPLYAITGRVTDGSSRLGGFGVLGVTVQAVDTAHAGRSTMTSNGNYRLDGIAGGNVTLSAAGDGYATTTKTVDVTRDTIVDFALPRVAKTATPNVAGVWGAQVFWGFAWIAEFTLSQDGSSVAGTWRSPAGQALPELRGTISGTIDGERTFTARMTVTSPCAAAGAVTLGLLDYPERHLTFSAAFPPASAGCPSVVSGQPMFELDRTCRLTSFPSLSCTPP